MQMYFGHSTLAAVMEFPSSREAVLALTVTADGTIERSLSDCIHVAAAFSVIAVSSARFF